MLGGELESHESRSMIRSLEYSSFPFVAYLLAMHKRFGAYPRYAVATSSDGPDHYLPKYHYVAVAKAVLETFARYMATHLQPFGTKVNVVRTRSVITESFKDVFGERAVAMTRAFPEFEITADEVADAIYALCSGLFDAVSGQIITLDKSAGFADNLLNLGGDMIDRVGTAMKG
jgi:enoyl-[acyl-carrier-protein] reductase (NADH)